MPTLFRPASSTTVDPWRIATVASTVSDRSNPETSAAVKHVHEDERPGLQLGYKRVHAGDVVGAGAAR